ncbi:MAG: metallophosphoesterase family protein [Nocardioidaceae bacterium]
MTADPPDPAAHPRARRALTVVVLVLAGLVVGGVVAVGGYLTDARSVGIGAHRATVSPTFDGYATFVAAPLLPDVRIPTALPMHAGVHVVIGESDETTINGLLAADALIASHPQGDIARIRSTVKDMALANGIRGVGAGVLTVLVLIASWRMVGAERRDQLVRHAHRWAPSRRRILESAVLVAAVIGAVLAVLLPRHDGPLPTDQQRWVALPSLFPSLTLPAALTRVQVASNGATAGGVALINKGLTLYNQSVTYYGDMENRVAGVAPQIHVPASGDTVALMVSDRHDNIGMDDVAAAVGRAGSASLLIDAGDDTSNGGAWEQFSINSLQQLRGDMPGVAVAGNHDHGPFVSKAQADAGFTVLDGKVVTVDGITFLGSSDPRGNQFGSTLTDPTGEVQKAGDALATAACAYGRVSTVVVHDPAQGVGAAASGCVGLVLSGHVHHQIGPTRTVNSDHLATTSYTNGTTGGAATSFALGTSLGEEAEVTLITYRDGRAIGLQPVRFETNGTILVDRYRRVATGPSR